MLKLECKQTSCITVRKHLNIQKLTNNGQTSEFDFCKPQGVNFAQAFQQML